MPFLTRFIQSYQAWIREDFTNNFELVDFPYQMHWSLSIHLLISFFVELNLTLADSSQIICYLIITVILSTFFKMTFINSGENKT